MIVAADDKPAIRRFLQHSGEGPLIEAKRGECSASGWSLDPSDRGKARIKTPLTDALEALVEALAAKNIPPGVAGLRLPLDGPWRWRRRRRISGKS